MARQAQHIAINLATSGDNTLVAASPKSVNSIFVSYLECQNTSDTTVTVIIKLGATALNGAGYVLQPGDTYRYKGEVQNAREGATALRRDLETGSGNAFILNLSAAKQISGFAFYTTELHS